MLYRLQLKNTEETVIVSEDAYNLISQNPYLTTIEFIKRLRIHSHGYAFFQKNFRRPDKTYKNVTIYLHRYIAEHLVPKPESDKRLSVTFKNGNRLDCRTDNIIWATWSHIVRNTPNYSNSEGQYRGVYKLPSGNFQAIIFKGKQAFYLGTYPSADEAALAYNAKSIEWFGKTKSLNKVKPKSE